MVFYLTNQKNNLKTKINVSPINKNTVQTLPTKELKYFFDLKPNAVATFSADFLPQKITTKYNNDRLNDTQNYSIDKDSHTFRIITLGDSYTYGLYINTKDNWTEILERKLNKNRLCKNINKFEVINLGHRYCIYL